MVRVIIGGQVFCQFLNLSVLNSEPPLCDPGYARLLTQRSSCIGRLLLEKRASLFVQALRYFVVCDVNQYMMKRSPNLSSYTHLIAIFIRKSHAVQERAYKSQHETILADFNPGTL